MKIKNLLVLMSVAVVLAGCVKEPSSNPALPNKPDGPVFDFSTAAAYTLDFKYDVPEGYVVGFDVYAEYPYEIDADGRQVLKAGITPVDRAFTDSKGAYSAPLEIPAYVKEVYVCTNYAGVPSRMLVAEVGNNRVLTPAPLSAAKNAAVQAPTRAAAINMNTELSRYFSYNIPGRQTLTLGKWHLAKYGSNPTTLTTGEQINIFGRPDYMSYVNKLKFGDVAANDALKIEAGVLQTINTALLGDNSGVPVDDKYLRSGDIHVSKEAELDLIFIQNWGAYRNTLAYYCYDTQTPPASVDDIKFQVIAIPNAMEQKMDFSLSDSYDVLSMFQGEGVKLKYVDKSGVMHDKFPANTSVGWILYRDGFDDSNFAIDPETGNLVRFPGVGVGANYSTAALSDSPNTAVLRYKDFVVVGFDDGDKNSSYRDYLDVMFNVKASPSDAITDEVPDVDPEEPAPVVVKKQGVLLFEDLWPFQGDFDMNDVVVKYVAEKTRNKDNAVTESKVDFTVLHSGASLNNSFAYTDPNLAFAEVTVSGGAGAPQPVVDKTNNIVYLAGRVLDYANKADKVTFTVNYKFATPLLNYTDAPFNPFVISNSEAGKEVHLTNYRPSSAADLSWFDKRTHDFSSPTQGLYYITYENHAGKTAEERGIQLPWAVDIKFDSVEALDGFKVTVENKRVDTNYKGFLKWVQSAGKENTDWYLHYQQ